MRPPSINRVSFGFAAFFFLAALLVLIPPINDLYRFFLLATALLVLACSDRQGSPKRLALGLALALSVFLLRFSLLIGTLQETHNVFFIKGEPEAEPWSQILPPPVLEDFTNLFQQTYPAKNHCDPNLYGCWRFFPTTPQAVAWSADNFWDRKTGMTRETRNLEITDIRSLS